MSWSKPLAYFSDCIVMQGVTISIWSHFSVMFNNSSQWTGVTFWHPIISPLTGLWPYKVISRDFKGISNKILHKNPVNNPVALTYKGITLLKSCNMVGSEGGGSENSTPDSTVLDHGQRHLKCQKSKLVICKKATRNVVWYEWYSPTWFLLAQWTCRCAS